MVGEVQNWITSRTFVHDVWNLTELLGGRGYKILWRVFTLHKLVTACGAPGITWAVPLWLATLGNYHFAFRCFEILACSASSIPYATSCLL